MNKIYDKTVFDEEYIKSAYRKLLVSEEICVETVNNPIIKSMPIRLQKIIENKGNRIDYLFVLSFVLICISLIILFYDSYCIYIYIYIYMRLKNRYKYYQSKE